MPVSTGLIPKPLLDQDGTGSPIATKTHAKTVAGGTRAKHTKSDAAERTVARRKEGGAIIICYAVKEKHEKDSIFKICDEGEERKRAWGGVGAIVAPGAVRPSASSRGRGRGCRSGSSASRRPRFAHAAARHAFPRRSGPCGASRSVSVVRVRAFLRA